MFNVKRQAGRLASLNLRKQVSGPEKTRAIDLGIVLEEPSTFLSSFDAELPEALYTKDLVEEGTVKKFKPLEEVVWALEVAGARVTLHRAVSELTLESCEVNKFRIRPFDAGKVEIAFRIQTSRVPDGLLDTLHEMLGEVVEISIEGPA